MNDKAGITFAIGGLLTYMNEQFNILTLCAVIIIVLDWLAGKLGKWKTKEKTNENDTVDSLVKATFSVILWILIVMLQYALVNFGEYIGIKITAPVLVIIVQLYIAGIYTKSILKNFSKAGYKTPRWIGGLADKMTKGGDEI